MHIAIIGTRGIPNNYGGFEQFAEYLSVGLVNKGFEVSVYNSHNHPYQGNEWKGAKIIHCFDPEDKLGSAGQFIYDLNCILDTRKRNFDIILQLGYTSSSVWGKFLPSKRSIVTTNMDGLEWKRTKYSKPVQRFLHFAEKLAVLNSDFLIADSIGIKNHIQEKYSRNSVYIPYGAYAFKSPHFEVVRPYGVNAYEYDMLIARLEPENSIEVILDGVARSGVKRPFLVIGKHETTFGNYLKNKFKDNPEIRFLGGLYDINILNNLRYFSNLYFHGHTVGGTNPSLLEAMASNALICAHDNVFNKSILGEDACYFDNADDVAMHIKENGKYELVAKKKLVNNFCKIENVYSWPGIVDQYIEHFKSIARNKDV